MRTKPGLLQVLCFINLVVQLFGGGGATGGSGSWEEERLMGWQQDALTVQNLKCAFLILIILPYIMH